MRILNQSIRTCHWSTSQPGNLKQPKIRPKSSDPVNLLQSRFHWMPESGMQLPAGLLTGTGQPKRDPETFRITQWNIRADISVWTMRMDTMNVSIYRADGYGPGNERDNNDWVADYYID
jgi:hypothetical protein